MKREICMALTVVLMGCSGGQTAKEPESYNYKRGCEAASDGNTDEAMTYFQQELDDKALPEEIRRAFYTMETADHVAYYGLIEAAYLIED